MGFIALILFSTVLGTSTFFIGLLPLFFGFSRTALSRLSTYGTGLLLGAALGIIIPEGIETIYAGLDSSSSLKRDARTHVEPPTFKIALALLSGFTFMLAMEQLITNVHAQSQSHAYSLPPVSNSAPKPSEFTPRTSLGADDIELEMDLRALDSPLPHNSAPPEKISNPNMMTFGLVIHSLADGLALGASFLPGTGIGLDVGISARESGLGESLGTSGLSLVVFLAIIIHKSPAALALTTTLMPSLSPRLVRAHIAVFSLASPLSAVFTYIIFSWFGSGGGVGAELTGLAIVFSGGTFLYVATLLSPLSASHSHPGEGVGPEKEVGGSWSRIALIVAGMFTPALLGGIIGHGH